MLRRDFLEFLQMYARVLGVALALISARQSEFGGSVKREHCQRGLKCSNRGVILLQLRIEITNKIKRVRLGWSDFGHMLKSGDRFFLFAYIFVDQAQVVPGVGVARQLFRGLQQSLFGVV